MTDPKLRLPTHCPHGVYLRDDICMSCMTLEGEQFICRLCGVSGNDAWADEHLAACLARGMQSIQEVVDEIPF